MDFFDQGADQGLSIQRHPVLGFYLGDDLGDMKGPLGPSEYVYCHAHIRHTFIFPSFGPFRFRGFELSNGTEDDLGHGT